MDIVSYDTVARFCMVTSLLLFVGLFLFVLTYVFRIANRERLEAAQRDALDLSDKSKIGAQHEQA